MDLPSIFFSLTCQVIAGCIAVDVVITATEDLVTLVPSPLAEYCSCSECGAAECVEQKGCAKDRKQLV